MTIDDFITQLIEREKGYVNHPSDLGGETKYGITKKTALRHGYSGSIKDLPYQFAVKIYKDDYWYNPKLDKVHQVSEVLANELLDTGVNLGVGEAIKMLQRSLNAFNRKGKLYPDLKVDGILGSKSLYALYEFLDFRGDEGESVLLKALNCLQGARYIRLCEMREANEHFVFGWFRKRVEI